MMISDWSSHLYNYKEFFFSFLQPHSEFGKDYKLQSAVMWEAGLLFHGRSPNRTGKEYGEVGRGGTVRQEPTCHPHSRLLTSQVLHCELEAIVRLNK